MARKRLTAVGYMRVSSQEQAKSGLSLEEQRREIEATAQELGADLIEVFVDEGVSGGKRMDERDGLAEALGTLPRRGLLIVSKRDRLGRDLYETSLVEKLVESRKGQIVSAAGEGTHDDRDDPGAFLMRAMTDLIAHYERLMGKVRMRAAARAKKARGEAAGFVPFGYRVDRRGKLERDPGEWRVVEAVFQARGLGLSQREIVAQLAAGGFVSPRSGKPLWLAQVQRILKRFQEFAGDSEESL